MSKSIPLRKRNSKLIWPFLLPLPDSAVSFHSHSPPNSCKVFSTLSVLSFSPSALESASGLTLHKHFSLRLLWLPCYWIQQKFLRHQVLPLLSSIWPTWPVPPSWNLFFLRLKILTLSWFLSHLLAHFFLTNVCWFITSTWPVNAVVTQDLVLVLLYVSLSTLPGWVRAQGFNSHLYTISPQICISNSDLSPY